MSTSTRPRKKLVAQELAAEAFLADSVVVTADGKLYVQGGAWNVLSTPVLPYRHPRIGIAMILRVPYEMATPEPVTFSVRLEDADGSEVPIGDAPPGVNTPDGKLRRIGGQFVVGRPPGIQQGDEQLVPVALNGDGLVFAKAGIYRFVLEINGQDVKSMRFRVVHLTPPPMVAG